MSKALEAAADAAEEAVRAICVCEDADGMSHSILDALAETRGEKDLGGAADVIRDASLDIARAVIAAYFRAVAEDERLLTDLACEIGGGLRRDDEVFSIALEPKFRALISALEPPALRSSSEGEGE